MKAAAINPMKENPDFRAELIERKSIENELYEAAPRQGESRDRRTHIERDREDIAE